MKGTGIRVIALMVGLLAVAGLHTAYAADRIELLVPAETAAVESGGAFWTAEPIEMKHETGNIVYVRPAESAKIEVAMGAGEDAGILLTPFKCVSDRIELLCPAK